MRANGSDQRRLVPSGNKCYGDPAWSPRGTKIAFTDVSGIYTVSASGGRPLRLTRLDSSYPTGSADGRLLAFLTSYREGHLLDYPLLYVMNADGSALRLIATDVENEPAAWSPSGRRLVFHSTRGPLYITNADGSGQKRLSAYGSQAAWSPDGRRIAYARASGGPDPTLLIMNANGSRKRQLARGDKPAWSPDGKRIAFSEGEGSGGSIHVMNADGTHQRKVADDGHGPLWQP